MAFGVDETGFFIKTLNDLVESVGTRLADAFGAGVDLSYDTVLGKIRGVLAGELDELWQQAQNLYNSRVRQNADGVLLDNLAALLGLERNGPTKAIADVDLTGTADTVVPAGTEYGIGSDGAVFVQDADATLTGGSASDVGVTAKEAGAVSGGVGAIDTILTAVAGLDTVTNPSAIIPGLDAETDAELRIRMAFAPAILGINTLDAIYARLSGLDDVLDVAVYENETGAVDAEGRPEHSVHAIVYPDSVPAQSIADILWNSKASGIETHGAETATSEDSQGIDHTVHFDYATEVSVNVTLTGTKNDDYPADGDTQIEEAISAVISAVRMVDGVVRVFHLYGAIDEIPGLVDATITVPAANIVLNVGEKAVPGTFSVTVT